jgi:hypothetical protein
LFLLLCVFLSLILYLFACFFSDLFFVDLYDSLFVCLFLWIACFFDCLRHALTRCLVYIFTLCALIAGAFVSDEVDDRAEKCEAERSRGKGRDRASEGEGCLFCWRVWFQVASMRRRSNEACSLFVSCLLSFCRFAQIRLFRFVCSVVPDAQFVCSPAAPCKSRNSKLHSGNSARFSDSFAQIRLLRFVCSGLLAMFVLDAQVFYVHLMGFRD